MGMYLHSEGETRAKTRLILKYFERIEWIKVTISRCDPTHPTKIKKPVFIACHMRLFIALVHSTVACATAPCFACIKRIGAAVFRGINSATN